MATLKSVFNKCQIFKIKAPLINLLQQNGMSQYPAYYISPIYKRETQEELIKAGEAQKLMHVPTKAALIDQTCSPNQDQDVSLFINYVMRDGQKRLARELVAKTFEKIKRIQLEKYHKAKTEDEKANIELNPKIIFHNAVENCKPLLQLTPIKRGGVRYQVPVPITDKRAQFMSMKWLLEAANDKERTIHFPEKMAYELIEASNNTGRVVKKKQDLHRQCEANRAFAHYRWG